MEIIKTMCLKICNYSARIVIHKRTIIQIENVSFPTESV